MATEFCNQECKHVPQLALVNNLLAKPHVSSMMGTLIKQAAKDLALTSIDGLASTRFSSSSSSKDSKMSIDGWWMVHTMVLPVLTMLRTVLMTMAAALASSPATARTSSSASHAKDCAGEAP